MHKLVIGISRIAIKCVRAFQINIMTNVVQNTRKINLFTGAAIFVVKNSEWDRPKGGVPLGNAARKLGDLQFKTITYWRTIQMDSTISMHSTPLFVCEVPL